VNDGRLTVAATGGTNTKLNDIEVYNRHRPYITGVEPRDLQTGVLRDGQVSASIQVVPPPGNGVSPAALTADNVRLVRVRDGQAVAGARGTTGGNDAINFDATGQLDANTRYRFEVDAQVTDEAGNPFVPLWSTFTTGGTTSPDTGTRFLREQQTAVPERFYTAVTMGLDGKLYAGTIDGVIHRFNAAANGTLSVAQTIDSLRASQGGQNRMLIGMAFDPAATASNLKLWVSHSTYGFSNMPDWGGEISTLSGPSLGTVVDEVTRLPRSAKDHLTNSLAFGPDGALYVSQGANTAGGDRDPQWGDRPERLLTAAILRVNTGALATRGPLDVQTEGVTNPYNPRPTTAPVRVYASGVRNAYDLVWGRNNPLYTAINGTAGGAISPATPSPLPSSCSSRLVNGQPYTCPTNVPRLGNLPVQPDLAARIVAGGYYGNPNPSRCEWVLNGGNPTSGTDFLQVTTTGGFNGYPVGIAPDPNWRRDRTYPLGNNLSPNGMIEYRNGGVEELDGKLLVTAFSNCNCILSLSRNSAGDVNGQVRLDTGSFVLENPLDLAQGPAGVLHVTNRTDENATTGTIELLRATSG